MKKKYIFIGILIIGLIFSILFSGKSLEMYINQDEDLSIIKTVSGIDNDGNLFMNSYKADLQGKSKEILQLRSILNDVYVNKNIFSLNEKDNSVNISYTISNYNYNILICNDGIIHINNKKYNIKNFSDELFKDMENYFETLNYEEIKPTS